MIINSSPKNVFYHFEEICKIPHGSGNMKYIGKYCMDFAKEHGLYAIMDDSGNVVIKKNASQGYENSQPVILQGHLDMVCQKTEDRVIDFENDGLEIYVEDDYIKAKGTTLGADNGIAVAMILAILQDNTLCHPPIEAVFTVDEEIGMLGAVALSKDVLCANRMINIDSEDSSVVTVSCAGGEDFKCEIPLSYVKKKGTKVEFSIKGLRGGHSGVEINSGRENANMLMGRVLNHLLLSDDFHIISLDGGDKSNAIPTSCTAVLVSENADSLSENIKKYCKIIKEEISVREENFTWSIDAFDENEYDVVDEQLRDKLVYVLLCAPGGVVSMSAEIQNLVETSLNMGVLKTREGKVECAFALRSNKVTSLEFLSEKLETFFKCIKCKIVKSGHYPPWEYNPNSLLRELYLEKYKNRFGKQASVEAIHAGLECGVFASGKKDFDCISIGPEMHDIHTVNEKLSISSTQDVFEIILEVLKALK